MRVEGDVRVVGVFVSSPGDVVPERGRAQAVAAKLNRQYKGLVRFETVLWEEHFYKADQTFQSQIPEAVTCDIILSIFWTRIGTELPPGFPSMANGRPYPSGTAYELLSALEGAKRSGVPDVYVFRKTADVPLPTVDSERRRQVETQIDALEAFWAEWFKTDTGQLRQRSRASPAPMLSSNSLSCCCGNGSRPTDTSARGWLGHRRRARRFLAWQLSRPNRRLCSSAASGRPRTRAGAWSPQPTAALHFC